MLAGADSIDDLSASASAHTPAAREAAARALASEAWKGTKPGQALELAFPAGMAAEALQLIALPRRADALTARKAGAAIGARHGKAELDVYDLPAGAYQVRVETKGRVVTRSWVK